MPPQPDIQKVYRDLLKPENLDLLIDLAKEAFALTVDVFVKARQIEPLPESEYGPVEDLGDVLGMLRPVFEANADQFARLSSRWMNPRERETGRVRFSRLSLVFKDSVSEQTRYQYVHRCCNELESLFNLIRVHRNYQQHQPQRTPQASQVLSLASIVLRSLDLAPPRFDEVVPARSDEVTRIRGQCHDAIAPIIGDALPTPDTSEADETLDQLRKDVTDERARRKEVEEREDALLGEIDRLRRMIGPDTGNTIEDVIEIMEAEHKSTSKKLAGAINDSENELKSAFQEETRELEQRLANIAEQVSAIRRAQRDHATSTAVTSERPEPEVQPVDPFVPDVMDSPAESALRKLRDRIRAENENLKGWENICMMRPIVEEALQAAELGKLNTLDDWRQLPWVKRKFSDDEKRRKQEEQLKRYGEEMMRIYARVRRRSARSVAG